MKLRVIHKSCQRRYAQLLESDVAQVKSLDGVRWSALLWLYEQLRARWSSSVPYLLPMLENENFK